MKKKSSLNNQQSSKNHQNTFSSYSTAHIKQFRKAMLASMIFPILIAFLSLGVFYGSLQNNGTEAAATILWNGSFDNGANPNWVQLNSGSGTSTIEYRTINPRFANTKYAYLKTCNTCQRAEVQSGGETNQSWGVAEGSRVAHAISLRFPAGWQFPPNSQSPDFLVLYQEKNAVSNSGATCNYLSPQRAIEYERNGGLVIHNRGGNCENTTDNKVTLVPKAQIQTGVWYDIIIDAYYSGNTDGWVDGYIKKSTDSQFSKVSRLTGATMYTNGSLRPPTFQRVGIYRNAHQTVPTELETTGVIRYADYNSALSRFNVASPSPNPPAPTPPPPTPPSPSPSPSPPPTPPSPSPSPSPSAAPTAAPSSNVFGKTTLGTSWTPMTVDAKRGSAYTYSGPTNQQMYQVGGYVRGVTSGSGSQNIGMAVYSNKSGQPGDLLAKSVANRTIAASQDVFRADFTLDNPITLVPGATYWLMYHSSGPQAVSEYAHDSTAGGLRWEGTGSDSFSDGPVSVAGVFNTDNKGVSIWAVYRTIPSAPTSGNPPAQNPIPPITIPGSNPTTPVAIPVGLPKNQDGSFTGDFNADGLNDIAIDKNGDNMIDPNTEITVNGLNDPSLTDTSSNPVSVDEYADSLGSGADGSDQLSVASPNTITINAGPIKNAQILKPLAYTFITAQAFVVSGLLSYLAVTKLSFFATIKGKFGL